MTKRPNIVFFTWHDAGDWFGCYGYDTVSTPHIDRLAREGVCFAHNFSACAICSPSRAAIMTGRFCQNNGVMTLTNTPFMNRIHPHTPHMARRFKQMGYRTALFGVQHEACHEHAAEIMGYDEQIATDPWPNADLAAHYMGPWLHERAADDGPFFVQVGTIDAHLNRCYTNRPVTDEPYPPVQDTEKGLFIPPYLEYNEAGCATVATLQGQLRRGDRLMGAILVALDQAGLTENTLVVMCVDHGVGLTRAKTTCYDPGLKTAWIMRKPGLLPVGHVVDAVATHVDVMPTLWDLLELEQPKDMDGCSLAAHARGEAQHEVHEQVFGHMVENARSLRTRTHKLIRNFRPTSQGLYKGDCAKQHQGYVQEQPRPEPDAETTPCTTFPSLELYDLAQDPHETRNLAMEPDMQPLLKRLNADLWNFLLDNNDFIVHDPVRTRWQAATRHDLEEHGRKTDRKPAGAEGPLGNLIDEASSRGTVVGRS